MSSSKVLIFSEEPSTWIDRHTILQNKTGCQTLPVLTLPFPNPPLYTDIYFKTIKQFSDSKCAGCINGELFK